MGGIGEWGDVRGWGVGVYQDRLHSTSVSLFRIVLWSVSGNSFPGET